VRGILDASATWTTARLLAGLYAIDRRLPSAGSLADHHFGGEEQARSGFGVSACESLPARRRSIAERARCVVNAVAQI